jgi:uncharacterized protein DUF6455
MSAVSISVSLLLFFVAAVVAAPFIHAAWRRIGAREADLQIWRLMARRGIAVDDSPAAQPKLARVVRRCVLCPSIEECDHWLASDGKRSVAEFCPNAAALDELGKKQTT